MQTTEPEEYARRVLEVIEAHDSDSKAEHLATARKNATPDNVRRCIKRHEGGNGDWPYGLFNRGECRPSSAVALLRRVEGLQRWFAVPAKGFIAQRWKNGKT